MARSVYLLTLDLFGIARHAHHGRTQQAFFELVAALQLVENMIVFCVIAYRPSARPDAGWDRTLALRRDRLHAQLGQRIVKLLVDEFDARLEVLQRSGIGLQRAIQAVEDGQQLFERVGQSVLAILLLLLGVALAKVVELGLQAGRRSR